MNKCFQFNNNMWLDLGNRSKSHIYKSKKYYNYKYSIQYISGMNLAASTQLSMNLQLFMVFQFTNYSMDS